MRGNERIGPSGGLESFCHPSLGALSVAALFGFEAVDPRFVGA